MDRLLKGEEISEVIQRDTTLWCPTKGEFLQEVGEVVSKAQDAKSIKLRDEEWKTDIDQLSHPLLHHGRGCIYIYKDELQALISKMELGNGI